MSKENTKKFFDDVTANETLKQKLLESPASAWITSAKGSGLDISMEEVADELIVRVRGMLTGELGDSNLDGVSGGAGPVAVGAKAAQIQTAHGAANLKAQQVGGINQAALKKAARW